MSTLFKRPALNEYSYLLIPDREYAPAKNIVVRCTQKLHLSRAPEHAILRRVQHLFFRYTLDL